jgi:hypothetical protein
MEKTNENHSSRVSGVSGRTAGRMYQRRAKASSERRGLRRKNQLKPVGKDRFPFGKYQAMDA